MNMTTEIVIVTASKQQRRRGLPRTDRITKNASSLSTMDRFGFARCAAAPL